MKIYYSKGKIKQMEKEIKLSENGRKVLEVMKDVGTPMKIADLSKKLDLSPKSLPGLMNGLVKRNLVSSEKHMGLKEKTITLTEYKVINVTDRFPNAAGDAQYNEKQEAVLKWLADGKGDTENPFTFTVKDLPFPIAPATLTSLVKRGNLAALPEKKKLTVSVEVEQTYYTLSGVSADAQ